MRGPCVAAIEAVDEPMPDVNFYRRRPDEVRAISGRRAANDFPSSRLLSMFCGWIWYIQFVSGTERMSSKYASAGVSVLSQNRFKGRRRLACCLPICARTSPPLPPASRTRILVVEFSDSLLASTRPARPPPMITKSYESWTSPGAIQDCLLRYNTAADASDKDDIIIIISCRS